MNIIEKLQIKRDSEDIENFNKELNTLNQDYIAIMHNCEDLLKSNENDINDTSSNEMINETKISNEQRNMVRRSVQLMKDDVEPVKLPYTQTWENK